MAPFILGEVMTFDVLSVMLDLRLSVACHLMDPCLPVVSPTPTPTPPPSPPQHHPTSGGLINHPFQDALSYLCPYNYTEQRYPAKFLDPSYQLSGCRVVGDGEGWPEWGLGVAGDGEGGSGGTVRVEGILHDGGPGNSVL